MKTLRVILNNKPCYATGNLGREIGSFLRETHGTGYDRAIYMWIRDNMSTKFYSLVDAIEACITYISNKYY